MSRTPPASIGRLNFSDRLSPRTTIRRVLSSFLETYPAHNHPELVAEIYFVARSLLQEFDEEVKAQNDAEEHGEELGE
jgi:hypothetical protein